LAVGASVATVAAVVALLWAATAVDETDASAADEVAAVFAAACADGAEAADSEATIRREALATFQDLDQVVSWRATSPAIDTGDCYTIRLTNGSSPQSVFVRTVIMDHAAQVNTPVLNGLHELAAGETLTLQAVNDYGAANHFATTLVSQNEDMTFEVTVADEAGQPIAWYSERAFMVEHRAPGERLGRGAGAGHQHEAAEPEGD
jgi:hypothetical protein